MSIFKKENSLVKEKEAAPLTDKQTDRWMGKEVKHARRHNVEAV